MDFFLAWGRDRVDKGRIGNIRRCWAVVGPGDGVGRHGAGCTLPSGAIPARSSRRRHRPLQVTGQIGIEAIIRGLRLPGLMNIREVGEKEERTPGIVIGQGNRATRDLRGRTLIEKDAEFFRGPERAVPRLRYRDPVKGRKVNAAGKTRSLQESNTRHAWPPLTRHALLFPSG